MRKRFHGWVLTTVLGGATGVLAQDMSDVGRAQVIDEAPTRIVPATFIGGPIGTDPDAADVKKPELIEAQAKDAAPKLMPNSTDVPPMPGLVAAPAPTAGGSWGDFQALMMWASPGRAPQFLAGPARQPSGPVISGHHVPTSPGFIGIYQLTSQYTRLDTSTATSTRGGYEFSDPNFGGRLVFGTWLDSSRTFGVEIGYSYLHLSNSVHVGSAGEPELAIPTVNGDTGKPSAFPIAQSGVPVISSTFINTTPDVFVGLYQNILYDRIAGQARLSVTGDMQNIGANAVLAVVSQPDYHLAFTAGPRFVQLDEDLRLSIDRTENYQHTNAFPKALGLPGIANVPNDVIEIVSRLDQFDTQNRFYGGQVGTRGEVSAGRALFGFDLGIAVGDMEETVSIAGQNAAITQTTAPPQHIIRLAGIPLLRPSGPVVTHTVYSAGPTGLFAQPTNAGSTTRNVLAFIPQGNLRFGYRLSDSVTATLGYSFLYINDVARPGEQIDYAVHPGSVGYPYTSGGAVRPLPQIHGSDFWVQGVELGLAVRY
jgi:hypothetical protein